MSGDPNSEQSSASVVVFKTWQDSEAEVIRSLLKRYGIECFIVSDVPHSVWPLSMDGLGEVRIGVLAEHADQAKEIIRSYGEGGEVPLPPEDTDTPPDSESA